MSARQLIEAETLRTWFGKSQVVDATGAPLKVFHGTTADFDTFDPDRGIGGANWFTADPETASMFTYGDGARLHPVYLRMENPLRVHATDNRGTSYWAGRARRKGHDGLIVTSDDFPGEAYAVFDPANIRSAIGATLAEGTYGLRPAIRGPSGMVYTAPKGEPQMHFFAYIAAADAGEFVNQGISSGSELIRAADKSDDDEADLMDALRAETVDGFVDWNNHFMGRAEAAEMLGQEEELDSMDLLKASAYESRPLRVARLFEAKRSPDMKTLKKHKVPLTPEERAQVMKAGAVWHHGPGGEESPAVWKSKVKDRVWYVCNTHRAAASKPTLRGAIASFKFIETTS